jgi:protein-disulfide isomerase
MKLIQDISMLYMEETKKVKKMKGNLIVPVMCVALIAGAFLVGRLSAQVEYLSKGGVVTKTGTDAAGVVQQQAVAGDTNVAAAPSNLTADGLKKYAKDLGLDEGKFNSCLDDGKNAKTVADDLAYGNTLGVSGTPSFFINGVMVVGAQPQSEFEKVIDAELKDGSGDKAEGVTRKDVKLGVGPILGNSNAKVKIVEFSDFECPFCKSAHPTVKSLLQKYGDKVSLEYRYYPLSFHPNADRAAQAAQCALEQNKFWELHDKMFEG